MQQTSFATPGKTVPTQLAEQRVNIQGFLYDIASKEFIVPAFWLHKKYGIGEFVDAHKRTDGWIVKLEFCDGETRSFLQRFIEPHSGIKSVKLGHTVEIEDEEEEGEVFSPAPPVEPIPLEDYVRPSDEEMLRRMRL